MKRRPTTASTKVKRRPTVVSTARYTVDAAAKALELLSVFSFREPRLSLADLARRTLTVRWGLIGAGHVVRYCKALRKSAIAIGASTGRFLVDASTLIRLSYPIWRRAAKNGA